MDAVRKEDGRTSVRGDAGHEAGPVHGTGSAATGPRAARRTVLLAAGLFAFGAAGCAARETPTPKLAAPVGAALGDDARPGPPAAVPPRRSAPRAGRLRPLTGHGPLPTATPPPPVRGRPFFRLPGTARAVALTFDDGPDPRYTPAVLSVLREHDVRATFFVCGENASAHPEVLRAIAGEGHLIGNHSWTHRQLTKLGRRAMEAELTRTGAAVEDATGVRPAWFRAPYGAWNKALFELGARHGMEPLAWSLDTEDWTRPGAKVIADRVLKGADPGAVVLSHDGGGDRTQSVEALRRYLPGLLDAGWRVTLPRRTAG